MRAALTLVRMILTRVNALLFFLVIVTFTSVLVGGCTTCTPAEYRIHYQWRSPFDSGPGEERSPSNGSEWFTSTPPAVHRCVAGDPAVRFEFVEDALADQGGMSVGGDDEKALALDSERRKGLLRQLAFPTSTAAIGEDGSVAGIADSDKGLRIRTTGTYVPRLLFEDPDRAKALDRPYVLSGKVRVTWTLAGALTRTHALSVPETSVSQDVPVRFTLKPVIIARLRPREIQVETYKRLRGHVLANPGPVFPFNDPNAKPEFKARPILVAPQAPFSGEERPLQSKDYFDTYFLFTLLHCVKDGLRERDGEERVIPGYEKERLRLSLARQLTETQDVMDAVVRNMTAREVRLAKPELNQHLAYHTTYAYCNLSLIISELQILLGEYLAEVDKKREAAPADRAGQVERMARSLGTVQQTILARLMNSQRATGGWRYLWGDSAETDMSVSILAEFTLSDAYRLHYMATSPDLHPRLRLRNVDVVLRGERLGLQNALEVAIPRARERLWSAVGREMSAPSKEAVMGLTGASYELGNAPRFTLLGGFYSAFAGAYRDTGTTDKERIDAAQAALTSGIPVQAFRHAIDQDPANPALYYNQMFFGRALTRAWFARQASAAERAELDKSTRELLSLNLNKHVLDNLGRASAKWRPEGVTTPIAEAMHAYFLSLCYRVVEDMRDQEVARP